MFVCLYVKDGIQILFLNSQLEFTSEKLNGNHPGLLELFKLGSKNEQDVDVGKISISKSMPEQC